MKAALTKEMANERPRGSGSKASLAGTQSSGTIPLEKREGKVWEMIRGFKMKKKKKEEAKCQQAAASRTPYPIITYNGVKYSCMVEGNVAFWRHADGTDPSWVDVGGKAEQMIRRAWKQHISAGCASPNHGKTRCAC